MSMLTTTTCSGSLFVHISVKTKFHNICCTYEEFTRVARDLAGSNYFRLPLKKTSVASCQGNLSDVKVIYLYIYIYIYMLSHPSL